MKKIILFVVISFYIQVGNSQNIPINSLTGAYDLYNKNTDQNTKVGEFIITTFEKKTFVVRGDGWVGKGEIEISGNNGYYDWKFDDGKMGQTTFTINSDGTLVGHVFGSGLDWWYIARPRIPQSKPGV